MVAVRTVSVYFPDYATMAPSASIGGRLQTTPGYSEPGRMAHLPLDIGDLAHRLIDHEADGSSASVAVAVDRACGRLSNDLSAMLGSRGVAALFGRALKLATRERPVLVGVTITAEPLLRFDGLSSAIGGATDEEAIEAGASILAHLLGLLVLLLGEELAVQPVRKLWPDIASSSRETGQ